MDLCTQSNRIGAYHDGELTPTERAEFEAHLQGCPACRADLARLRGLSALLGAIPIAPLPQATLARMRNPGQWYLPRLMMRTAEAAAALAAMVAVGVVMWSVWGGFGHGLSRATGGLGGASGQRGQHYCAGGRGRGRRGCKRRLDAVGPVACRGTGALRSRTMRRAVVITVICCLVVFGAGLGVGSVLHPPLASILHTTAQTQPDREQHHDSSLTKELNLTPAQQEQMRQIWQKVMRPETRPSSDPRRTLEKQHEQDIRSLLTPAQLVDYDRLTADYRHKLEELANQRQAVVDAAVAATRAILDPAQRDKYDQILKSRGDHRHGPHVK